MSNTLTYKMTEPGDKRVGMVNWIGMWTMYAKEVRRFMKVWTQTVAAPTITTCLFMAIFVWALSGTGRETMGVSLGSFLAPGLMMMAVIQNAFQNPASSIVIGKVQGAIVDVLMPPLSAFEILIGYVMGGVTRGLSVGFTLWLVFFLWPDVSITVHHWWAVFYHLISASVMLALIGTLTGIWAEKFDHSSAVTNFVIVPLSLLSGTFYSITRLPEVLQTISAYNPFFYLIDGLRYGFIDHNDSNLLVGVVMTLSINIVLYFWVHHLLKTGYKLKP
ncbi:MAG: ABC transporter permease [Sphingomonadales bacterium]|nr:ABC transporter permease [Sphingomonadales bacterium]